LREIAFAVAKADEIETQHINTTRGQRARLETGISLVSAPEWKNWSLCLSMCLSRWQKGYCPLF
jgi:hypothetical protein